MAMRGDGLSQEQVQERLKEKYAALEAAIDEYFEVRRIADDNDHDEHCDDPLCAAKDFRESGVHTLSTWVVLTEYATMAPQHPDLTGTATSCVSKGSPVSAFGLIAEAFQDWGRGN